MLNVAAQSHKLKTAIVAIASLCALVAINSLIIFREGWVFVGFPHCYIYTALEKYYGIITGIPKGNESQWLAWNWNANDNIFSPLYYLSTLLGHLGKPTPPWFRLTGVVLLILIFMVSYFMFPAPQSSIDRLLVAMTISTTPIVFFITRYLEDFGFNILILLLGAMILLNSAIGEKTLKALPFYLLPFLSFVSSFMATNFVLMMMSFCGIYLYSILFRSKEKGLLPVIVSEIPRLVVAAVPFLFVKKIRPLTSIPLGYYGDEMARFGAREIGAPIISSLFKFLAYPSVLFFSAAGVFLCLIALLNFHKKLRGLYVWMYLLWMLIPLAILTPIPKKSTFYVWLLAPAISLLAVEVILKFPRWAKVSWLALCFVFAALHLVCHASPFERHVFARQLWDVSPLIKDHCYEKDRMQQSVEAARKVLKLAEKCKDVKNYPIVAIHNFRLHPMDLYFSMLYLNQKMTYWFLKGMNLEEERVIFVEVIDDEQTSLKLKEPPEEVSIQHKRLEKNHVIVYETENHRVYCPRDSINSSEK